MVLVNLLVISAMTISAIRLKYSKSVWMRCLSSSPFFFNSVVLSSSFSCVLHLLSEVCSEDSVFLSVLFVMISEWGGCGKRE